MIMVIETSKIAHDIVARLKTLPKPDKFLGAVLVGSDSASLNFLKQKEKIANELGIAFRIYQLPTDITTDKLRAEIGRLARPRKCGGLIVQLPLPDAINRHYVLNAIPKEKDADCLSEATLGAFYTERSHIVPPSVGTVEEILKSERRDVRALKVVMVGAGFLIGKPIGFWLQNKVSELVVLDASVKNLNEKLADADIVISGTGHAHLFGTSGLKRGAVVIDFGFTRVNGKSTGDFNPDNAYENDIDYTPTPGGTGPILVAKLFENFYRLRALE